MITIMSKCYVEDCYEELNARLRTLIRYYDDINTWRMKPISKMQMALQHVVTFMVTFLESFLARKWEQNIICYLIADESAPASNQLLETKNTYSSSAAMMSSSSTATTSLSTSAKSIASELSTLRVEHVSCQSSEVDGSHEIVIQQQWRPPTNRQANALERIITKIGQNVIDKICVDWASMETNRAGAEWQ
jgi:hypothetical protein